MFQYRAIRYTKADAPILDGKPTGDYEVFNDGVIIGKVCKVLNRGPEHGAIYFWIAQFTDGNGKLTKVVGKYDKRKYAAQALLSNHNKV